MPFISVRMLKQCDVLFATYIRFPIIALIINEECTM